MTEIKYNKERTIIASNWEKILHKTDKKEYKYLFSYWFIR